MKELIEAQKRLAELEGNPKRSYGHALDIQKQRKKIETLKNGTPRLAYTNPEPPPDSLFEYEGEWFFLAPDGRSGGPFVDRIRARGALTKFIKENDL